MLKPFRNRADAGRKLALKLADYAGRQTSWCWDYRAAACPWPSKWPGHGSTARCLRRPQIGRARLRRARDGCHRIGGARVLNDDVVEPLNIPDHVIQAVAARELKELARRERLYRDDRPLPERSRPHGDTRRRRTRNGLDDAGRCRSVAAARTRPNHRCRADCVTLDMRGAQP